MKRKRKTEPPSAKVVSPNEGAAAFRATMERAWNLDGLLDEIDSQARAVLKKPKTPRAPRLPCPAGSCASPEPSRWPGY